MTTKVAGQVNDTLVIVPILLTAPGEQADRGLALAIRHDRVVEVAPENALLARHPGARIERMPNCLLMPGLVNAHQHGRGLSRNPTRV